MNPTTDGLAGGSATTTEQPSAGTARQAPDPAAHPVAAEPAGTSPRGVFAGTPSPDRAPRPAGEGTTSPSAGTTGTDSVPADGSRTFTIEMPAGLKLLSLNGREHWAERARRTETLKKAAWAMALARKVPRLERASIIVEYQPPDRRRRDADNPAPSVKACVDGIVAAGCLVDDECPRYVTGISCTIGPVYPKGRLVLHLTEVAEIGGAA